MTTFTLTLKLGNDAMRTGTDVAKVLARAAAFLEEYYPMGLDATDSVLYLRDQNGARVGRVDYLRRLARLRRHGSNPCRSLPY